MRKFLASRPSPAMAVAFVALLAALSGTAIALPGSNSVDSGDIANNSVRSKDIRNSNVTSRDVRNSSLTGTDVRNDSLTGSDINESTLGQVPSANTANSATTAGSANTANSATTAGSADSVGGITFRSFRFAPQAAAPSTEILNLGGLVLNAACSAGAILTFTATTTETDAQLDSYTVSPPTGSTPQNLASDGDFNAGDPPVNLVPTNEDAEVGELRFTKLDGSGVHVQWHAFDQAAVDCGVNGVASSF